MRKATWFLLRLFCRHRYKHQGFSRDWICGSMSSGYIYSEKFICNKCGNHSRNQVTGVRGALAEKLVEEHEKIEIKKFKTNVDREYYKYKHSQTHGSGKQ